MRERRCSRGSAFDDGIIARELAGPLFSRARRSREEKRPRERDDRSEVDELTREVLFLEGERVVLHEGAFVPGLLI